IGKAVNLKNRLANYFKSQLGSRTAKLMELATKIDWQETDSEIEALILESQLIKKHHPPFNVMLRDDKQYFYVGFTNEEFPKIFLTHQIFDTNFIGPFTDGLALKTALRLLRKIFPYCTCKQKHNNYCLNYHIGKCLGFCCLKNRLGTRNYRLERGQKIIYSNNIKAIREILSGKRTTLIKKFKKEMTDFAENEKFDKAIDLRNKIEKIEKVFENAQILRNTNLQIRANAVDDVDVIEKLKKLLKLPQLPQRIEGYDISNIQGKFATGAMIVFTNGQPDKNQYRKFKIEIADSPNDIAMLKEVLTRRFNHQEWPWPDLIIVDGGKAQLNATRSAISNFK
ncbi:MAG: UvrB/UvrC motif-containing protein, partial [Candidatus Buchananbacteria bacterium]|nr:UvrB/UvrC motif-containing protein [Candidatus Buchananbacteria bacterium]